MYQGTETRDDYTGWNVSTELIPKLERERVIEEETLMRMAKTQITNEAIVKDYKSPQQLTAEFNKKLREEKQMDAEVRQQMEEQARKEMPRTTKEKIDATVTRRLWEKKHVAEEPYDPELTLKPKLTVGSKRSKVYYHTGKWEESKWEEGEWAWSCCQNSEEQGEGCNSKLVDPDKYNLVSF